jgi:hypothetical protein
MTRSSLAERLLAAKFPLAEDERAMLNDYEGVIERGQAAFMEVGQALVAIRDRRLYRMTHPSFDLYCRERWGFTRQRAHQLTEAAEVIKLVSTSVDIIPANEAQARELVPLIKQPEQMVKVWSDAVGRSLHGHPTAKTVREAVAQRVEPRTFKPRTDVVGTMALVLTHADRAARAAEQIDRSHLRTRGEEVTQWKNGLAHSYEVLGRLLELLQTEDSRKLRRVKPS